MRQAFAAFPSIRTWCIYIYVWYRNQGVIVTAHFLFAHSQGLKGVTIFHLPVTQCLTPRHHHTPPNTHCRQRKRGSNKERALFLPYFVCACKPRFMMVTVLTWLVSVPVVVVEGCGRVVRGQPTVLSLSFLVLQSCPVVLGIRASHFIDQTV